MGFAESQCFLFCFVFLSFHFIFFYILFQRPAVQYVPLSVRYPSLISELAVKESSFAFLPSDTLLISRSWRSMQCDDGAEHISGFNLAHRTTVFNQSFPLFSQKSCATGLLLLSPAFYACSYLSAIHCNFNLCHAITCF